MKKLTLTVFGLLLSLGSAMALAGAQSHAEHRGGGSSGKNNGSEKTCKEARVGKIKPAALSEVAPGSEFSFWVFDANNPKQIEVSVKNTAVPVTLESKGEIVVVHAQLPPELKATPARIHVKIKGKSSKCTAEEGWLLKITE